MADLVYEYITTQVELLSQAALWEDVADVGDQVHLLLVVGLV